MLYDLIVIGDDPEGLDQAIDAARCGQNVAVVRELDWVPTPGLQRDSAMLVAQLRNPTIQDWKRQVQRSQGQATDVRQSELNRWRVRCFQGTAQFLSETTLEVSGTGPQQLLCAAKIVIGCGTRSRRPASLQADQRHVIVAESLLEQGELPASVLVVGAGRTGQSVAISLAALGADVTVIEEQLDLIGVCGMLSEEWNLLHTLPIAFRVGEEAIGTEIRRDGQAAVRLASGRILSADLVVICTGREGRTGHLNLEAANVGRDEHGRIWCDRHGQTWAPRITVVGELRASLGNRQMAVLP